MILMPDLFSFAYVPNWYSQLDMLAEMALPEPWRFKNPIYLTKNPDTPILERYIHAIFKKQLIDYKDERNPSSAADYFHIENEFCCFHTGLYTRRYKAIYRNGGDIHAQTTSVIYHIPFEQAADKNAEHYKERRTIAKNCNFGVFFGLFPKGLQRTLKFKAGLDTPLAECEKIIANLKAGYPQLSLWQEVVKRQAKVRRYSETWLGRRRYLPGIVSDDWGKKSFAERCAMNTPIQGTAADILKLALGRLIVELPDYDIVAEIAEIGSGLSLNRPGIREMAGLAHRHMIDAVLVSDISRLCRDCGQMLRLEGKLKKQGVSIESMKGNPLPEYRRARIALGCIMK